MKFKIPDEINKAMTDYKPLKTINLSQDWVDDILSYGFTLKGIGYVINNRGEIHPIDKLKSKGYVPITDKISKSSFPMEYLNANLKKRIEEFNTSHLIKKIHNYLKTYIYLEECEQYNFLTIWIMGTYIFNLFRFYPYIHIQGEKNSGKSTLLDILTPIVFNGLFVSSISGAALFRIVNENSPTLCIDEFDTSNPKKSESELTLIKISKDGFKKGGKVIRCHGDEHNTKEYNAYCPKIFAGINEIEDVLADRMIRIPIKRKTLNENIKKYVGTKEILLLQNGIKNDLYLFGLKSASKIYQYYLEFDVNSQELNHLSNRSGELWSPIFSIARYIEEDDSNKIYLNSIINYSKRIEKEKGESDKTNNEIVSLLHFLRDAICGDIETCTSIEHTDKYVSFDTEAIYQHFLNEGLLQPFDKKTKLTQKLKRTLDIRVHQYFCDEERKTRKQYIIDLEKLRDSTKRYIGDEFDGHF